MKTKRKMQLFGNGNIAVIQGNLSVNFGEQVKITDEVDLTELDEETFVRIREKRNGWTIKKSKTKIKLVDKEDETNFIEIDKKEEK